MTVAELRQEALAALRDDEHPELGAVSWCVADDACDWETFKSAVVPSGAIINKAVYGQPMYRASWPSTDEAIRALEALEA